MPSLPASLKMAGICEICLKTASERGERASGRSKARARASERSGQRSSPQRWDRARGLGATRAICVYLKRWIPRSIGQRTDQQKLTTICSWNISRDNKVRGNTFARQAIPDGLGLRRGQSLQRFDWKLDSAHQLDRKVAGDLPAGPPGHARQQDAGFIRPRLTRYLAVAVFTGICSRQTGRNFGRANTLGLRRMQPSLRFDRKLPATLLDRKVIAPSYGLEGYAETEPTSANATRKL